MAYLAACLYRPKFVVGEGEIHFRRLIHLGSVQAAEIFLQVHLQHYLHRRHPFLIG